MKYPDAGIELRALVAERVMGWTRSMLQPKLYHDETGHTWVIHESFTPRCPHTRFMPDVDISAAWQVVERMRALGFGCMIAVAYIGEYDVTFWKDDATGHERGPICTVTCHAALEALGVEP